MYSILFKSENEKSTDSGKDNETGLQAEMNKMKNEERKNYGWHLLAKDVADFCNVSFFEVFEKTACEILSIVMVMQSRIRINENSIQQF